MKKFVAAMAVVVLFGLVGCKQYDKGYDAGYDEGYWNGHDDGEVRAKHAANFIATLSNEFSGFYTFEFVKFGYDNPDYVVIKYDDGFGAQYMAVNVSTYAAGTGYHTFMSGGASNFFGLVSNGNGTYGCPTDTCYSYTSFGYVNTTMVFEKATASSKDLQKAAAFVEEMKAAQMSENLAAEFGLSEERSLKVAKLANQWGKIAKSRKMTNADADAFAKEVLGSSVLDIETAYKASLEGKAAPMQNLIQKAAKANETSPEQIGLIMTKLFM